MRYRYRVDWITWLLWGASGLVILALVGGTLVMVFGSMIQGPKRPDR